MWRSLVCLGIALGVVGMGMAQDRPTRRDVRKGQVIRVVPDKNVVVVRVGTGTEAREFEYRVTTTTKYWGTDQQPFTTGLRYEGFREGTQIWYRVGPGQKNRVVSEIRFYEPGRRSTIPPRKR